ncbi:MAG: hypothetical protein SOY60_07605 [Fusobacterium gastrosuis]|uniref:hypothetical protein n=1 Tax=Fusobacterium gastrosuis TaxID=1755100 RepID=UPI002A860456|nr:hypothetical protein [Fusobacterium gastrosuis]
MKKKILILCCLLFLIACGEAKETSEAQKQVVAEEVKFENFAYYKNNEDRHFQIYTKAKDKDILIKEARAKTWTEGRVTVVSFWSTKDDNEVPYLTLAKDEETGIFMEGISNLNPKKLIGVYFKDVFGNEKWYRDDLYLKDALTEEELKEVELK